MKGWLQKSALLKILAWQLGLILTCLVSVAHARQNVNFSFARPVLLEPQKVAIGFSGDPVPPSTGSGAAVTRNSQRLSRSESFASSSRSQLSKIGIPIALSVSRCTGWATSVTRDGITSLAASLPNIATSRSRSHLAHEA